MVCNLPIVVTATINIKDVKTTTAPTFLKFATLNRSANGTASSETRVARLNLELGTSSTFLEQKSTSDQHGLPLTLSAPGRDEDYRYKPGGGDDYAKPALTV
jgi:hypothetical protein